MLTDAVKYYLLQEPSVPLEWQIDITRFWNLGTNGMTNGIRNDVPNDNTYDTNDNTYDTNDNTNEHSQQITENKTNVSQDKDMQSNLQEHEKQPKNISEIHVNIHTLFLLCYVTETIEFTESILNQLHLKENFQQNTHVPTKHSIHTMISWLSESVAVHTHFLGQMLLQLLKSIQITVTDHYPDMEYMRAIGFLTNKLYCNIDSNLSVVSKLSDVTNPVYMCMSATYGAVCLKTHVHVVGDWRLEYATLNELMLATFLHLYPMRHLSRILSISVTSQKTQIVMPYLPFSFSMFFTHSLVPPNPLFIRRCCSQLIQAVEWLHVHGYSHRDIKPENIRFQLDGSLVLLDFDTSCNRLVTSTRPCGSIETRAPELYTSSRPAPYDPFTSDIFSMGCVMIAMHNDGHLPFLASEKMIPSNYAFHPKKELKERLGLNFRLIEQMVSFQPENRPAITDVMMRFVL